VRHRPPFPGSLQIKTPAPQIYVSVVVPILLFSLPDFWVFRASRFSRFLHLNVQMDTFPFPPHLVSHAPPYDSVPSQPQFRKSNGAIFKGCIFFIQYFVPISLTLYINAGPLFVSFFSRTQTPESTKEAMCRRALALNFFFLFLLPRTFLFFERLGHFDWAAPPVPSCFFFAWSTFTRLFSVGTPASFCRFNYLPPFL